MNLKSLSIFLALLTVATPALAKKDAEHVDPGPPPTSIQEFRELSTSAILAGFFDPDAAQITWDRGITGGYWKPLLSKKIPGWFTCGVVNGKNRFGAYVGPRRFIVVYNSGKIVFNQTGEGGQFDLVQVSCDKAISQGVIPRSGEDQIPSALPDPLKPRLGLNFNVVPDGAYITAVIPNGGADSAALIPGMVISHVNGVALKGFDQATVLNIIQAAPEKFTLTIIGKGEVSVVKKPLN